MSFFCDDCRASIVAPYSRFVCWTCDENQETFDLCESCAATHPHPVRKCKHTVVSIKDRDLTCAAEKLFQIFEIYNERKCLGSRFRLQNGDFGDFKWMSYGEVGLKAQLISAYLQNNFKAGSMIGVCGKNSEDWYISEYAIVLGGFISVPIYHSFNEEAVHHIIGQTELVCVFSTREQAPKFLSALKKFPSLTHVILMNEGTPIPSTLQISDVVKSGRDLPFSVKKRKMNDIASLRYTSGLYYLNVFHAYIGQEARGCRKGLSILNLIGFGTCQCT